MRHSLTPTAQDPDARASAGEPHAQGLSGDRRGAQDARLPSPSLQDVPLLEVAGRHRQEARRVAGLPGRHRGLGPTGQEHSVGRSPSLELP